MVQDSTVAPLGYQGDAPAQVPWLPHLPWSCWDYHGCHSPGWSHEWPIGRRLAARWGKQWPIREALMSLALGWGGRTLASPWHCHSRVASITANHSVASWCVLQAPGAVQHGWRCGAVGGESGAIPMHRMRWRASAASASAPAQGAVGWTPAMETATTSQCDCPWSLRNSILHLSTTLCFLFKKHTGHVCLHKSSVQLCPATSEQWKTVFSTSFDSFWDSVFLQYLSGLW